jgi:hypothetical protein
MALVVVHALAHWLVDYRPSDGATIGVDLGAAGSWTWRREQDAWATREGIDAPDARVSVASDSVVAVLTRGVPRTAELLTIEGDEQLAYGAMALVAPLL